MPKLRKPALGFDISGPGGGAALEFDGEYGRSIRFKDGTPYTIEITNSGGYYAVSIKIDGAWVTRTPMIVYPKGRKVPGFTAKTTSSRETNDDGTAGHYQIEKEIRPFVACKPETRGGAVNANLGRIEFFCFPIRWVKNTARARKTRNRQQAGRGAGRAGVLMTVGGEPQIVHGSHPGRPSIPIADTRAPPFLVYKITVCERA